MCTLLSNLLALVAQCGAIVGKLESMIRDFCCFLHLVNSHQTFLTQLFLLLGLSVVVKIDCATGHCVATQALGVDSVLDFLLVQTTTAWNLYCADLHQ